MFKEKIRRDEENERNLQASLNEKSKECQNFILKQIEDKRAKGKGMTKDEFELNKDLLKEIVTKKNELRQSIMMTSEYKQEKSTYKALPAYEIYNFWEANI